MTLIVDKVIARRNLEIAWGKCDDPSIVAPVQLLPMLEKVLTAKRGGVLFKYCLITGLLSKITEPRVHTRSLQKASTLTGAYDTRTVGRQVVAKFEREKGKNLWGWSGDPFVGNPGRRNEHDKDNPQIKMKSLAIPLHDVLEFANVASPSVVEAILVEALRISRRNAADIITLDPDLAPSLIRVTKFVQGCLQHASGGAGLAVVVGAFLTLFHKGYSVKVYHPNAADAFAGTAGDVEIFLKKQRITAYECKHRQLSLADVQLGIAKAKKHGLSEYGFIYVGGISGSEIDMIQKELAACADTYDIPLVDMNTAVVEWTALLNPIRRAAFAPLVVTLLRDNMKLEAEANAVALLWNSLE